MKYKLECLFCEKDLSKEKFREDYILVAVQDDPKDPSSSNKIAKPVHKNCYKRFLDLNL